MSSVGIMASAVVTAAAFPVVATVATENAATMGTNNVMTAPAGITAGDLLVLFVSYDATIVVTASTGWTQISDYGLGGTPHKMYGYARIADGGANDTLTMNAGTGSQDYCAVLMRITGHAVTTIATDIKLLGTTTGTASNADPPNLNAGSVKNWLWLAVAACDLNNTGQTITAMPASYTQVANLLSASSTTSTTLAVAYRNLSASSEDPGAFTNTARPWMALTVAIPPP